MKGVGVVDVSARGRLLLGGGDRVRFLQGMVTNDVAALGEGTSCRAAMLDPKGHVLADMLVRAEPDAFLVSTEPELRGPLLALFDRHIIVDDVTLADESNATAELAVYGAGAAEAAARASGLRILLAPLGAHVVGEPALVRGFADELHSGGAVLLDAEAVEALRIERGVTRWGREISPDVLPLEAGLDDAISHTKGCYVGQEPVARVTTRGHVNKKVVGLLCAALPAAGDRVSAASRPDAGMVTSAVQSPTLGRPIALAFLHRSLLEPGTGVTVGQGIAAEVAALPFVVW